MENKLNKKYKKQKPYYWRNKSLEQASEIKKLKYMLKKIKPAEPTKPIEPTEHYFEVEQKGDRTFKIWVTTPKSRNYARKQLEKCLEDKAIEEFYYEAGQLGLEYEYEDVDGAVNISGCKCNYSMMESKIIN